MAKKTNDEDFSGDFWLHVTTDSLRRYMEDGGRVDVVVSGGDMQITLFGVTLDDERVHGKFAKLIEQNVGSVV